MSSGSAVQVKSSALSTGLSKEPIDRRLQLDLEAETPALEAVPGQPA
jgi:hypothetical protein